VTRGRFSRRGRRARRSAVKKKEDVSGWPGDTRPPPPGNEGTRSKTGVYPSGKWCCVESCASGPFETERWSDEAGDHERGTKARTRNRAAQKKRAQERPSPRKTGPAPHLREVRREPKPGWIGSDEADERRSTTERRRGSQGRRSQSGHREQDEQPGRPQAGSRRETEGMIERPTEGMGPQDGGATEKKTRAHPTKHGGGGER